VGLASSAAAGPRILALDHCADQYVLALSPRESIVGISKRADDADSMMRAAAVGLPLRRPDLEAVLAARAEVVVVDWVADRRLLTRLRERGVEVVEIGQANSFDDVRRNVRRVAAALGAAPRAEALIARMDAELARSAGAWKGATAVYMTPGGFTAGSGTLVGEILRAAGMTNAERRPGYQSASLESLALHPPKTVVLGFFDTFQLAGDSWGPGRHQVLQAIVRDRAVASLPGELLGCSDWSAADAALLLASKAPR
jgi:iron complex transport system substrate-binding protein